MRIGIDARLINETGVGRYIRNLIDELSRIHTPHTFVVFLPKHAYDAFVIPNNHWEKRVADVHWHTLKEQIVMPKLFRSARLDIVHVPYFNIPVFSSVPFVVTIHDLTILHFKTGKATTLPYLWYLLKRIGYQCILRIGVWRAKTIITVSKTVKQDIIQSLHVSPDKISVTYEGVDPHLWDSREPTKKGESLNLESPYVLYVGNAYPHKNLHTLIRGFELFLKTKKGEDFHLVLVGSDSFFYNTLKKWVASRPGFNRIFFTGPISDAQLIDAYMHASALVLPSLSEGFGLPGLEALQLGCPVVCSDIPIFHEILGPSAYFFDPYSEEGLAATLEQIVGKKEQTHPTIPSMFSWGKMAKQTLSIYERWL